MYKVMVVPQKKSVTGVGSAPGWHFFGVYSTVSEASAAIRKAIRSGEKFESIEVAPRER